MLSALSVLVITCHLPCNPLYRAKNMLFGTIFGYIKACSITHSHWKCHKLYISRKDSSHGTPWKVPVKPNCYSNGNGIKRHSEPGIGPLNVFSVCSRLKMRKQILLLTPFIFIFRICAVNFLVQFIFNSCDADCWQDNPNNCCNLK